MRMGPFSWNLFWKITATSMTASIIVGSVMFTKASVVIDGDRIGMAFVVSLMATVLLSGALARRWSARIDRIRSMLGDISKDGLSSRSKILGTDELDELARSFFDVHNGLSVRMRTLDQQYQTLSSLIHQLNEGVIVVDSLDHMVLVNPAAVRLLRLTPPRPDGGFDGIEVERCIPYHNLQELLVADHPQKTALSETQLHLDGPNGTICILARACNIELPLARESAMLPVRGTKKHGRLLLLSDITELNHLIQMKTDFVANASHELRTPLASLLTAVETLQSNPGPSMDESTPRILAIMERNARRMESLVKDLLELSRIEAPSSHFVPCPLNTTELIHDLHATFAKTLATRQIEWRAKVASDCVTIVAHPELLRTVLNNLLENAIRFTAPSGWVCIEVLAELQAVRLEISDNGCGIAPEDQPRVFERFFQVSRARSGVDRGTGLGLAIVRHAVIAMNGSVALQSTPDHGTRVTVTLPRQPVQID